MSDIATVRPIVKAWLAETTEEWVLRTEGFGNGVVTTDYQRFLGYLTYWVNGFGLPAAVSKQLIADAKAAYVAKLRAQYERAARAASGTVRDRTITLGELVDHVSARCAAAAEARDRVEHAGTRSYHQGACDAYSSLALWAVEATDA